MQIHYIFLSALWFVSAPITVPVIGFTAPKLWIYLAGNVLTQYPFQAVHLLTCIPFKFFTSTAEFQMLSSLDRLLSRYMCISSVFILTTECTSLTVTLVVTLRKFLSLIFSIMYFRNPFTIYHWFGTTFVFGGTLVFTGVVDKIRQALSPAVEPMKKKD